MTERRVLGGACFLVDRKMACGTVKQDLCVYVGPDMHDRARRAKHTRVMDFTGRPMRGFVYVAPAGLQNSAALRKCVALGVAYARSQGELRGRSRKPPDRLSRPSVQAKSP